MRGFTFLAGICAFFALLGQVSATELTLPVHSGRHTKVRLHVGVYPATGPTVGDILFLTGFADRQDNHGPLFQEWNRRGFRVISFDYPSHGQTTGSSLNSYTFSRLAGLVQSVELETLEDPNRPLILAGWSTGGLLATRIVQTSNLPQPSRPVRALILFAPGISVRNIVGEFSLWYPFGKVTKETLSHDENPPHHGEIEPKSPGSTFMFAVYLKVNSWLSQWQKVPKTLPILAFLGGDDSDVYADTENVREWIDWQKSSGGQITKVENPGARHEIDNETSDFGGPSSRLSSGQFAKDVVQTLQQPPVVNPN